MTALLMQPEELIGTWRRFGELGPVYEVVGLGKSNGHGQPRMRIRVVESDEEADYDISDILGDPRAEH